MKGIYLTQDLSHADGINDKIKKQVEQFLEANIQIELRSNTIRTGLTLVRNLIPFFSKQYFNVNLHWKEYDFVYIRKGAVLDLSVVHLVKVIKNQNPSIKIILEIPTYPYMDEFPLSIKWDVVYKEKLATPYLSKYIDRVVTYSDDKEIFNIPCINISNAYEFKGKPQFKTKTDDTINFIAVASLMYYHGYDRIINGLIQYYQKNQNSQKVIFTLIGDGPVLKDYKKIVEKNGASSYIFLVGRKSGVELFPYYLDADIAVDSLGRHRSKIYYNSTLKGKEYLAKGLPIISGVKTDLDERKDFPYYYRVLANDTEINISDIVDFYNKVMCGKDKKEVASEIYNYGKNNFSFGVTFRPIINYLKESVK
ncbi:MAG: glycosyltransferase family 1 protein [Streptococcaceae bacterium]|nr:glycosyltransferase family 1 protein [Streptococcaceae bacterium]